MSRRRWTVGCASSGEPRADEHPAVRARDVAKAFGRGPVGLRVDASVGDHPQRMRMGVIRRSFVR